MVFSNCDGPDPPQNDCQEISSHNFQELMLDAQAEESDDETDYLDYQPLPQGPDGVISDYVHSDAEQDTDIEENPQPDVPPIETMETTLTREVWSNGPLRDSIQMDTEKAQQVMSAMANFSLPATSIPPWAQTVTEDQWQQTVHDRIQNLNNA